MLSKNNRNLMTKRQPHYGLRKFSVGLVSVLLSTTVYLGINVAGVQADTIANSSDPTSANVVQNQAPDRSKTPSSSAASSASNSNSTAGQSSQAGSNASSSTAPADVPAAQTPLNSQVGKSIQVTDYQVTQTANDPDTPGVGLTKLDLTMSISSDEVKKT